MFRSLFARLLIPYVLILVLVLTLQSVFVAQLVQWDYYKKVETELTQEGVQLAGLSISAFYPALGQSSLLLASMSLVCQKYSASVWLVDRFGNILQMQNSTTTDAEQSDTGDQSSQALTQEQINEYLDRVLNGESIKEEGTFANRFTAPVLSLGFPITLDGNVVGALFIHAQVSQYRVLNTEYYLVIGASMLLTTIIGAVFIFYMASKISRPLRQMNTVAGRIAKGDFTQKVQAKTRDEIGQLAGSFNTMADSLARNEQLRSGFVANVSHELRSPVTSMQGFAQGMLDGTISPDDCPKYLTIIRDESVRLTTLIKDLLDLAQIESGEFPLNIRRFDANELIRRVLIRYVDVIESNDVTLEVDFQPEYNYVLADADRIEQVLVNLVHNATKFVNHGGEIRLWTHQAGGQVFISIANTGEIIPEEDLPYIFERFYKVDKAHTGKKGTGLGLSIVQKIIEQHGQSISVRSSTAGGTSFTFTLNCSPQ